MNYTEEKLNRINDAIEDEAFAAKVKNAQNANEIKALFLERGIEVDDEFARGAYEKMEDLKNGGELTAEELEMVSGGKKKSGFNWWLHCVFGAVVGGAAAGGPGGAVAGAIVGTIIYFLF